MFADYSAEIKLAIFQSVSDRHQVAAESGQKLRVLTA